MNEWALHTNLTLVPPAEEKTLKDTAKQLESKWENPSFQNFFVSWLAFIIPDSILDASLEHKLFKLVCRQLHNPLYAERISYKSPIPAAIPWAFQQLPGFKINIYRIRV